MDRVYPEVRVRKSAIAPAFCLRPRNRRIICHTWFLFAVRSHGDEQRILHHWSHRRRGRRPEVVWPLLTEHDPDAVRSSPHTILCRRALIRLFPRSVKWTGRRDSHPDGLRHLQPVILLSSTRSPAEPADWQKSGPVFGGRFAPAAFRAICEPAASCNPEGAACSESTTCRCCSRGGGPGCCP